MAGAEYVNAAKRSGVYAFVLQWIAAYRRGDTAPWPGAATRPPPPRQQPPTIREDPRYLAQQAGAQYADPILPTMNPPRKTTELAKVPPPKRALDALHEAYDVLGIDDSKALTFDALRTAYKKAAAKAHPDRGGSAKEFDNVTRSFLYLEEVIKKLLPNQTPASDDPRLTQAVTKEAAMKARDVHLTKYDADHAAHYATASPAAVPRLEEPKVALNPKNLNMDVFNKLFEENQLPDPDKDDGYGDWLRSEGGSTGASHEALRSKFNKDVFNRTFVENAATNGAASALTRYQAPDAITHYGGSELGRARPAQYISPMGAKTGYTDLKYAYGEGSTFSQEVANVQDVGSRSFDQMKREREAAPVPLSEREMAVLASIEAQKKKAEEERQRRMAVHDVAAEDTYAKLQRRLMIQ